MKIKEFLQSVFATIRSWFHKVDDEVKILVPIAIRAVEAFKKFKDGPLDDIIANIAKTVFPGTAIPIDVGMQLLEKYLPIALLNLQMVDSIANISDPTERLKAIVACFKLSDDETKAVAYQDLCKLVLNALADGKLTLGECAIIGEWYYQNIYKKPL